MKKISTSIILVFVFSLMTSCDRTGHYQFQIKNETNEMISVRFQDIENDSVKNIIIKTGDSAIVLTKRTGILGKYEKPTREFEGNDMIEYFKSLQIKVGTEIINNDFSIAKYWSYKAENEKVGKYNLDISNLKK